MDYLLREFSFAKLDFFILGKVLFYRIDPQQDRGAFDLFDE